MSNEKDFSVSYKPRSRRKPKAQAPAPPEKPRLFCAILERGSAAKMTAFLRSHGALLTSVFMGQGTASSDILDILGLENSEKDIILSFASADSAKSIMNELGDRLSGGAAGKGIAFTLAISAAQNLIVKALELKTGRTTPTKENEKMDTENKYSLILASVNQGYADELMAAAKKAGARGGTLIRAHQTAADEVKSLFGNAFTPERELLAILVPAEIRSAVLDSINTEHGVRSEAAAAVIALAVDDVAKLSQ